MDTSTIASQPAEKPLSGARRMVDLLVALGGKLGFNALVEAEASEAAWVDVVWLDPRFANSHDKAKKPKLRRVPVLPVVAFEVENKTGLNAKHVKGSVSNLNNVGAQMGVIVIGNESFAMLCRQAPYANKDPQVVESELLARTYRWIYAEAQPKGRIVLMCERELNEWAAREGVALEPGVRAR